MKKLRSYSDYNLTALYNNCGIDNTRKKLSLGKQLIAPSQLLQDILQRNNQYVPINSEKARSELLITPILVE